MTMRVGAPRSEFINMIGGTLLPLFGDDRYTGGAARSRSSQFDRKWLEAGCSTEFGELRLDREEFRD